MRTNNKADAIPVYDVPMMTDERTKQLAKEHPVIDPAVRQDAEAARQEPFTIPKVYRK